MEFEQSPRNAIKHQGILNEATLSKQCHGVLRNMKEYQGLRRNIKEHNVLLLNSNNYKGMPLNTKGN